MRRTSQAPDAAGGDGSGSVGGSGAAAPAAGTAGGFGFSRLPMPQILSVTTRPALPTGNAEELASSVDTNDDEMAMETPTTTPPRPPTPTVHALGGRKESSVQVAVRVRPLLPKEIATRVRTCVESEGKMIHIPSNDKTFTFDHVFPSEASQKDLYEQVVQPLMDSFLQGFNVTVLAYGQTGSGKTYTMGNGGSTVTLAPRLFNQMQPEQNNADDSAGPETVPSYDHEGVIPRFVREMFTRLEGDKDSISNQVTVSFLEIYGEEIHDLLDQSRGQYRDTLQVRESKGSVWVQGLTEVKVATSSDAAEQMRLGCLRRITGSTSMNEHSSRSHAIYTVKIVRKIKKARSSPSAASEGGALPPSKRRGSRKLTFPSGSQESLGDEDGETTIVSKLTFVDLAGSERLKKTQAEGDRMKEGIQINVGLLALGNVITALGDERRRSNPRQHVSYRDSKLTRLLQDALGGNSRTLFIACVSPAESNAGETVNTLQYASRAKNIQNKAVKNIDSRSAELARSRVLNDILRGALIKACSIMTGDVDPRHITLDTLLVDPMITEYLGKLEEMAWSIANGASSSGEASMEMARAMAALVAQRSSLLYDSSHVLSNSSSLSRGADMMDGMPAVIDVPIASHGSSVHLSGVFNDVDSAPSLQHLCKVVEIIGSSLEIRELLQKLTEFQDATNSRITEMDARLARKKAVMCASEDALEKMSTWTDDTVIPAAGISRRQLVAQVSSRMETTKLEVETLSQERQSKLEELNEYVATIRADVKQKQQTIQQIRERDSRGGSAEPPSPMDLLLQVVELKHRFGLSELSDVAWALEDDEKAYAEFLDDERDRVAFTPKFFPSDGDTSAEELFNQIYQDLQNAIADEDLHTSQRKKLRERVSILQRIMNGWAHESHSMTEAEFLTSNEEQLRACEENIREISEALRYRGRSSNSIKYAIDAIDSLDVARGVIKRLVDALFGQKRLLLANYHYASVDHQEVMKVTDVEGFVAKKEYEDKLRDAQEKFDKELIAAFSIVSPFSFGALSEEHETFLSQRLSEAQTQSVEYEEQLKLLRAEAQLKDSRLAELESAVESMQKNGELSKKLERIERLRWELGMDPRDDDGQIEKDLTRYEEIRAKLQEQIEAGYQEVKRLEAILQVDDPIDIQLLQATNGKTAQVYARELHDRKERLKDELMHRVGARLKALDVIRSLVAELQVTSVEDLRHAQGIVSRSDLVSTLDAASDQSAPKELSDLRESLGDLMLSPDKSELVAKMISQSTLDQYQRVFKALAQEKVTRVTEMEDAVTEVRSLVDQMEFGEDDLLTLLQHQDCQHREDRASIDDLVNEVRQITRKAGLLRTNQQAFARLAAIRDSLIEVRDGRSNALTFVHSILDEGAKISLESLTTSGLQDFLAPPLSEENQDERSCREALSIGIKKLQHLSDPIETAIRALLFSMSEQFNEYGIETDTQRMSFFLGSEDRDDNPSKTMLKKYFGGIRAETGPDGAPGQPHADCLLSEMDPLCTEFGLYFSSSYGPEQLSNLKQSARDVLVIHGLVQSAQMRLESLKKIMGDYNAVKSMGKKIAEFAANASKKDRLFGNSKILMDEEKMRKKYARVYPTKLASLREEVDKWIKNECGGYNLGILGAEMKTLLLEMVKTDTTMMHLDLGTIDTARISARRASKSATGIATAASSAAQNTDANQDSSAVFATSSVQPPPRVPRPGSAPARDGATKRRDP